MSRWRWFRSGWDTAISLPPRIFIRIWTTLPRFLRQKRCWTGLEWVQIREMTLKKVWFLSKTGRFLSCYEIVKLKNTVLCIKKRYKVLKKHVVPLIGGTSEIWTLAALQTPYRISSATPSTSWVMLLIVIPQNLLRKKGRKVGENSKYLIVENRGFLTRGSLENQWQLPKCLLDFESSTSRYSSYISLFCFALNRLFSILTLVFDIWTYFVLYAARGCLGNI